MFAIYRNINKNCLFNFILHKYTNKLYIFILIYEQDLFFTLHEFLSGKSDF